MECLFCQMVEGRIPCEPVYQDEHVIVLNDIHPQAPIHQLIIPRKHIPTMNDIQAEDQNLLGHLFLIAKQQAHVAETDQTGYRLVFNVNRGAGQAVYHIHLHLLGGRGFLWPPG